MRKKNDKIFLEHMLVAIDEIFSFTVGDKEIIYNDTKTKRAVSKDFEIIGEASGNISQEMKLNYPEVPWRVIKDFRNVLVHDYWDVDYDMMWKIMENELPKLKVQITKIIEELK